MASYQTQITAPDGDVPSLPEEFLNEGEKMFYDVIDDEEGGNAQAKGFSRRDLVESDLKALPFRRFDSEHFEFMYIPGSDAERDLEEIASKREYARGFICSLFAVDPQEKHRIYVFETDAQSYCPTWGKTFASRAIPEGLLAGIVYSSDPKSYEQSNFGHELTHLFEYFFLPFMMRVPPYLREGMADFMSMSPANRHLRYVKFLKAGIVNRPFEFDEYKINTPEYMESASFIEYVSEVFGTNRLLDLYASMAVLQKNESMPPEKFAEIAEKALGTPLDAILKAYYDYICSLWNCESPSVPPEDQAAIRALFAESLETTNAGDDEGILGLYSSDFYFRTPRQDKDVIITHSSAMRDAVAGGFSFFPLDSWLYGESCAARVELERYGQRESRLFVMEKLFGTWRFSPKYPGGKSVQ